MNGFTTTVVIHRPVREVWQRLTDWERAPQWMSGIEACQAPNGLAAGQMLMFNARGQQRQSLVKEVVDEQRLVLVSTQGAVVATYTYRCVAQGPSTELTLDAVCSASGPMKLLMPLIRLLMKRADSGQPHALKQLLEA